MDIEYTEVDRETTPLGELLLRHYRASTGETGYEILLEGAFLMASHGCHAERAMAGLAHDRLGDPRRDDLAVLIGGLGAGHTLRAALDLPGVDRVVVAEIGARVVDWNRRHFADSNGRAVDDARVDIVVANLVQVIQEHAGVFDLVLLDVDNGPGWLASEANAWLYTVDGVTACRRVLRPGGVLAVWSPQPNPTFEATLRGVFPTVEIETTSDPDEPPSTIYLGRESASSASKESGPASRSDLRRDRLKHEEHEDPQRSHKDQIRPIAASRAVPRPE